MTLTELVEKLDVLIKDNLNKNNLKKISFRYCEYILLDYI